MIEETPEFERDYREMQDAIRRDPHHRGATGRCDAAIIRAWMAAAMMIIRVKRGRVP
jgi:hypothetical protein